MQIKRPTVPTHVECFSHITKLITTVNNLFTTPRTVNPVAEIALRQENPKKEIERPKRHDNNTGKMTWNECQSESCLISRFIFSNSPIISSSKGKSRRASRLLYSTRPHVFKPMVIITCFM